MPPLIITLAARVGLDSVTATCVGMLVLVASVLCFARLVYIVRTRKVVEAEVIACTPNSLKTRYSIRIEFKLDGQTRRLTLLDEEYPSKVGSKIVLHVDARNPDNVAHHVGGYILLSAMFALFGFLMVVSQLPSAFAN